MKKELVEVFTMSSNNAVQMRCKVINKEGKGPETYYVLARYGEIKVYKQNEKLTVINCETKNNFNKDTTSNKRRLK